MKLLDVELPGESQIVPAGRPAVKPSLRPSRDGTRLDCEGPLALHQSFSDVSAEPQNFATLVHHIVISRHKEMKMKRIVLTAMLIGIAFHANAAKRVINGNKIAFDALCEVDFEIFVMNSDGSNQRRLTSSPDHDTEPAWSPDGSRIAFVSRRDGDAEIYVMNENGSDETRLTFSAGSDVSPAWSPDGKKIAFVSSRDGNEEIYVMNANGTNPVRLTVDGSSDQNPAWSPNGQKIVFDSDRDLDYYRQIFIMNADGSNLGRLTTSDDSSNPSFSPDGKTIVFLVFHNPHFFPRSDIFVMNADGTNQVAYFTGLQPANSSPSFSPDGRKILFFHSDFNNPGGRGIATMNADGTGFEHTEGDRFGPVWQPAAPIDTAGVYRPSTGQWILHNTHTPITSADITLTFGGQPGDLPVAGDWNGDGRTDIGIFRGGTFLLALLKTVWTCVVCGPTTEAEPLPSVALGQIGDLPVAGDWNGDAKDDLGVYRPGDGNINGSFHLRVPQLTFVRPCPTCPFAPVTTFNIVSRDFGVAGDLPVAGDWDGDGKDTVGVLEPTAIGTFFLTDDLVKPFSFAFGTTGDRPLAGDWQGRFADRVGVYRPSTREMRLATRLFSVPDLIFRFGGSGSGDLPVAGHWLPVP